MRQNKIIITRACNIQNNVCRVNERDLCYFPIGVQSDLSDGSCERPAKRRRTAKDVWGNETRVLSLALPESQTSKPTISCTLGSLGTLPPVGIDPRTRENHRVANSSAPHFPGNYDLYPMNEYPLAMEDPAEGPLIPYYQTLYTSLFQSFSGPSPPIAQCHIPDPDSADSDGLLLVNNINDPLTREDLHSIRLTQIMALPTLSLAFDGGDDSPRPPSSHNSTTIGNCPGLSASLHVDTTRLSLDIVDSFGEFKMKRVWVSSDDGSHDMELFQGYFLLNVFYGEEYEERGCSPIVNHQLKFWGIRLNKERIWSGIGLAASSR